MELINPEVQRYAEDFSSAEDELLKKVAAYTCQRNLDAQMLSGHLQGKILEMMSCMIRPNRILEIGTFTGYSALCLTKGLTQDGLLHTIEGREDVAAKAKEFFQQSNYYDKIILHIGNALEIIPKIHETWDLVFIDADKPEYIEYFNLVLPKLRKNGFIFADNIFFHGEALPARAGTDGDKEANGRNAKGIKAFNEFIKNRNDIEKVVLTVRDGLYLIKKL